MDGWGIGILLVGAFGYVFLKPKTLFAFIAGIGAGILIGAIWSYTIVMNAFP